MPFRRGRFHELASRQLDLFASDEQALLGEAAAADAAFTRSSRDEAEEAYGDWQLVADAIGERILDLRETYAATLEEPTATTYRGELDRAARKRFPRFAGLLDE